METNDLGPNPALVATLPEPVPVSAFGVDPGQLAALADRCEKATGPDRLLDAQIAAIVRLEKVPHWAANWTGEWMPTEQGSVVLMEGDGKPGPHFMAREYTASLDAAMALVPDAAMDHAEIYRPDHQSLGWSVYLMANANVLRPSCEGFAPTLPLALCAAALRARPTP